MWRTPSHVDVFYQDGSWATWELGCQVLINNLLYKLVNFKADRSDVVSGDFNPVVSNVPTIKRALKDLPKPPAPKHTPVYDFYIIIGHDDLLGK